MTEKENKSDLAAAEDDDQKMMRRVTFHNRCVSSTGLTVTPPANNTPSSPVMQMGVGPRSPDMAVAFNGEDGATSPVGGCQCQCKRFERHHWKPICKYCSHAESFHDS